MGPGEGSLRLVNLRQGEDKGQRRPVRGDKLELSPESWEGLAGAR